MKTVLSPISSRTEWWEEDVELKMIAFNAVCYLVHSRRHLKNTRALLQKKVKKWSDEFLLTRNWPTAWPCSTGSMGIRTVIWVKQEMVHKAAILCKANANPENPMLSFFLQVHFSQDAPTHMYTYIHTHKNHFWAHKELLMVLNLYVEPQGVLHLCNRWREKYM